MLIRIFIEIKSPFRAKARRKMGSANHWTRLFLTAALHVFFDAHSSLKDRDDNSGIRFAKDFSDLYSAQPMFNVKAFFRCFKLLPAFAKLSRNPIDRKSVFFHPETSLNGCGVLREEYLTNLCKGKRVLHFGFTDSPFCRERIENGQIIHQQLKKVASFLFGLDIDAESLALYRTITGDHANDVLDIQKPLPKADFLANRYDMILFPEILEHLLHPGVAMENLRQICLLNPGSQLCITTPNAYSVMAFFTAVGGDELVHPDHYFYFSPSTLRKLVRDTGFQLTDLQLYASKSLLCSPGLTKHGLVALCRV